MAWVAPKHHQTSCYWFDVMAGSLRIQWPHSDIGNVMMDLEAHPSAWVLGDEDIFKKTWLTITFCASWPTRASTCPEATSGVGKPLRISPYAFRNMSRIGAASPAHERRRRGSSVRSSWRRCGFLQPKRSFGTIMISRKSGCGAAPLVPRFSKIQTCAGSGGG